MKQLLQRLRAFVQWEPITLSLQTPFVGGGDPPSEPNFPAIPSVGRLSLFE